MATGIKTGGRQKGTPNKRTEQLLALVATTFGYFNPIIELIKISQDEKTPLDIKASVLKDLSGYFYPKLKAVDVSVDKTITKII
jgi:hypothetical protein